MTAPNITRRVNVSECHRLLKTLFDSIFGLELAARHRDEVLVRSRWRELQDYRDMLTLELSGKED